MELMEKARISKEMQTSYRTGQLRECHGEEPFGLVFRGGVAVSQTRRNKH